MSEPTDYTRSTLDLAPPESQQYHQSELQEVAGWRPAGVLNAQRMIPGTVVSNPILPAYVGYYQPPYGTIVRGVFNGPNAAGFQIGWGPPDA